MKRASAGKRPPLKTQLAAHRPQLIVIAILIIVSALLGGYVWYSAQQWQTLSTHTDQTNAKVKARILALESKKHNLQEVQQETLAITEEIDSMCQVSPVVRWQRQLAPTIRDTLESCATYQKSLDTARDSLKVLAARAVSEQKFAGVLAVQQKEIAAVKPDDIEAQRAAWQTFGTSVKAVEVHSSLDDAKQSALKTGRELVSAYDALIKANKEENRTAYDEAIAAIQKEYSKLGEIQNLSVESYSRLVDEVRKTSHAL